MTGRHGDTPRTLDVAFANTDAGPPSAIASKAILGLWALPTSATTSAAATGRKLGIRVLAIAAIAALPFGMSYSPELTVSPHKPIDSIVMIRLGAGHAAGVVVDAERGLILTNAHVVGDRKKVVIGFRDGRELTARVLRHADDDLDLVLIKIVPPFPIKAALLSCRAMSTSESVVAIGHPGPFRWAVSKGHVAARYSKSKMLGKALVLDLTIWHGNSGGGLFDNRNRLIGITTAMFGKRGRFSKVYSGFSFAISGPDLCRFLKRRPATA